MFIRTWERENGKVTILIVETIREGEKVHKKTLRTVATVLAHEVDHFWSVAEHIKAEMEVEREPNLFSISTLAEMVLSSRERSLSNDSSFPVNLRKMREESMIVTGIHDI